MKFRHKVLSAAVVVPIVMAGPAMAEEPIPTDPPVTPIDPVDPAPTEPPAEPVPHGAWKRRVRALRLLSDVQTNGSTTAELWLLGHHRVHIDHAGYGSGLGGARPISKIQVSVRAGSQPPLATLDAQERHGWDSLPPWLVSEVARMLRVLFGLSPLPRSSRLAYGECAGTFVRWGRRGSVPAMARGPTRRAGPR